MATKEDVQKLASLARIRVVEEELQKFTEEFDSILAYVGKLEELAIDTKGAQGLPALRNVFREDGEPHESGAYTGKLVEAFPGKEGNLLSVKQIITHD
ncbi:MAG: Asp-tRNA(Asn)/Glu-tRNA(Gln) amidotransferase subunit GatC [bacterium]